MNTRHRSRRADRDLRIELLRLRAGYERLELARSVDGLCRQLSPAALAASAKDSLGTRFPTWLDRMLGFARRAPWAPAVLATLLGTSSRRRIALKAGLVAALVWLGKHPPKS